jgi:hypothetical protein
LVLTSFSYFTTPNQKLQARVSTVLETCIDNSIEKYSLYKKNSEYCWIVGEQNITRDLAHLALKMWNQYSTHLGPIYLVQLLALDILALELPMQSN